MKKSSFTEKQIVFALQQAEIGTPILDVCRKLSVFAQTILPVVKEIHRDGGGGGPPADADQGGEG